MTTYSSFIGIHRLPLCYTNNVLSLKNIVLISVHHFNDNLDSKIHANLVGGTCGKLFQCSGIPEYRQLKTFIHDRTKIPINKLPINLFGLNLDEFDWDVCGKVYVNNNQQYHSHHPPGAKDK